MEITLKCRCGSEVSFKSGTYINGGGAPDANGRIFHVEVRADQWIESHNLCWGEVVMSQSRSQVDVAHEPKVS